MITEAIQGALNSVGAGQEIGFGRLALQPVEMAEEAVGTPTFPKGFEKSDWLGSGEQLVAPPSPSAPHYSCVSSTCQVICICLAPNAYSSACSSIADIARIGDANAFRTREWTAALSLNGIRAPGAQIRGRIEVFDVVRVI
jgi:hypothetical protein